jgi:Xaa-Pro aminopeptidase
MIRIDREEFVKRVEALQDNMGEGQLNAVMVYGDEYRKENLRYFTNYWPIFERGALFVPLRGEPIYVGAPEGESYVREMGVWQDVRNVRDFFCVTVSVEIDYPQASFTTLKEIIGEVIGDGKNLGVIGINDMPGFLLGKIKSSKENLYLSDADYLVENLRLIKSPAEIACLREAGRIACEGYKKIIEYSVPGNTERMVAGAAEGATRRAGAEAINFCVFGSGYRTNTVIGRDTLDKVIQDGDMIMAALAVQYEGYTATAAYPFVAGKLSDEQKKFLSVLFEASNVQLKYLQSGQITGEMVRTVKKVLRDLWHR